MLWNYKITFVHENCISLKIKLTKFILQKVGAIQHEGFVYHTVMLNLCLSTSIHHYFIYAHFNATLKHTNFISLTVNVLLTVVNLGHWVHMAFKHMHINQLLCMHKTCLQSLSIKHMYFELGMCCLVIFKQLKHLRQGRMNYTVEQKHVFQSSTC